MKNKFTIKDTAGYGRGVFATDTIKDGEIIHVLTGQRISEVDCDDMIEKGLLHNDDPLQISKNEYFILDEISRSFNHSCGPNAALKKESTLFAIRDIKPGEEITYDYSFVVPTYNETFTENTPCLCGSSNCRKYLGKNVSIITKELLEVYLRKGALQDFIKESLNIS